jgi:hypothetical protein
MVGFKDGLGCDRQWQSLLFILLPVWLADDSADSLIPEHIPPANTEPIPSPTKIISNFFITLYLQKLIKPI